MNPQTGPTRDELVEFVYIEARLLDEERYHEWLALWHPDGRYWMPLERDQQDPLAATSLLYEDLFMLRLRVERLAGERTFSQRPRSRAGRLLQRPFVDDVDAAARRAVTVTPLFYVETRLDEQFLLALRARHALSWDGGALKIAEKRVDLLNPDAAFGSIQLLP